MFSYIFLIIIFTYSARGWLMSQVGLNESYRVQHLSAHFTRVFLSIRVESQSFPTLIEAQWRENYLPMHTTIFPDVATHANGRYQDCRRLQQACWSQVDSLNRLWVMDIGWQNKSAVNDFCPPKLLVYDLVKNNAEVLRIDCSKYINSNITNILTIKLGPKPSKTCQLEKFVYILLKNDNHLIAYNILEQHWQRRKLTSRKFNNLEFAFPIKPNDLAFGRRRELLISDIDGNLYTSHNSMLTNELATIDGDDSYELPTTTVLSTIYNKELSMELSLVGSLLGTSKGMMVNHIGELYYTMPKFGAVVRCDYRKSNLTAEGNEIIYITSKNIQQIFFGAQGSVWLLTDRLLRPQDHCYQDF